jgi:hypothetical protein
VHVSAPTLVLSVVVDGDGVGCIGAVHMVGVKPGMVDGRSRWLGASVPVISTGGAGYEAAAIVTP